MMAISEIYRDLDVPKLRLETHQILPEIKAVEIICVAMDKHQVANIHRRIRKILFKSVGVMCDSFAIDIYPITIAWV